jgi:hypothetical protein
MIVNKMKNRHKVLRINYRFKNFHFVYPSGKPMSLHLLCCQGLAVANYSFALGRLEAGAPSTFAQLGLNIGGL